MILSRIFSISFGFFILLSAIAYALIDTRPVRDQAFESNQNARYENTLKIYENERYLEEEDYALLALAVSGLQKEINLLTNSEERVSQAERLKKRYDINFDVFLGENGNCIHLDDFYLTHLRKHAYWYQNVILSRADGTLPCNPPQQNSEFLNRILIEDPGNFIEETSRILSNLFQSKLDPIGELEMGFLRENLHFLTSKENSLFHQEYFLVTGNNVNFRSGPGVENPVIGKLNQGNEMFCMDRDRTVESIGGKSGVWTKCFSVDLFRSGWIFSGQMEPSQPDSNLIQEGRKRFANLEFFTQIDFDNWNEKLIPLQFHGDYLPTKKIIHKNEVGFQLYRPEEGKVELICRKFSGRKNFLEIFYEVNSTELPIPIAELHIVKGGISYPVFKLAAERGVVLLNGNRFVIDHPASREILALKILPSDANFVRGTLIHKNKGIVENLRSLPVEEKVLSGGGYSWEICIPQAVQRSKDTAVLYGFRIGREL